MLGVLAKHIKEYKGASIFTVIFILGEVVFELLIPYMMTFIIDRGVSIGDYGAVIKYGSVMVLLALLGLFCGVSGRYIWCKSFGRICKKLKRSNV